MQDSSFLISLVLGAVTIASIVFLPALAVSIGWRAIAPLADDDDGDLGVGDAVVSRPSWRLQ